MTEAVLLEAEGVQLKGASFAVALQNDYRMPRELPQPSPKNILAAQGLSLDAGINTERYV